MSTGLVKNDRLWTEREFNVARPLRRSEYCNDPAERLGDDPRQLRNGQRPNKNKGDGATDGGENTGDTAFFQVEE